MDYRPLKTTSLDVVNLFWMGSNLSYINLIYAVSVGLKAREQFKPILSINIETASKSVPICRFFLSFFDPSLQSSRFKLNIFSFREGERSS